MGGGSNPKRMLGATFFCSETELISFLINYKRS